MLEEIDSRPVTTAALAKEVGVSVENELFKKGFLTQILDGDNIRSGINKNLKFTEKDRVENIRRIAEGVF